MENQENDETWESAAELNKYADPLPRFNVPVDERHETGNAKELKKKNDKDWPYPPGYNHLLGYCDRDIDCHQKAKGGLDVCFFDRKIKDGR